ncbi:ribbon-helix-helix protein, CopG family [Candidatus Woesearchaeota archaeon]|nr:ribbon-helix-helix protein, CopG family [Candidatus Woesearchaeota archaeon]
MIATAIITQGNRQQVVCVRLSAREYALLKEAADRSKLTVSQVVRRALSYEVIR